MASSIPTAGEFRSPHKGFQLCPLDTYSQRNLNSNQFLSIRTPLACPWCDCYAFFQVLNINQFSWQQGIVKRAPGRRHAPQVLYSALLPISEVTFPSTHIYWTPVIYISGAVLSTGVTTVKGSLGLLPVWALHLLFSPRGRQLIELLERKWLPFSDTRHYWTVLGDLWSPFTQP